MKSENKITVSRSVARKLSLQNYGGKSFESVDYFASYSEELPADTSKKDLKKKSDELFKLAVQDVTEAIQDMKSSLQAQRSKKLN